MAKARGSRISLRSSGLRSLKRLDLADSEIDRLFAEIVDTDDEHRSPVGLQLAGSRPYQDQRTLLARDKSGLARRRNTAGGFFTSPRLRGEVEAEGFG